MDPIFSSHGPASVIFWETICWFLCAIIVILAPLAGRYLFLAKDMITTNKDLLEKIKKIEKSSTTISEQYSTISTRLEIILDRKNFERSPKPIQNEGDVEYVDIDGKYVSLVDLERIILNVRRKKRRIDDYIDKE